MIQRLYIDQIHHRYIGKYFILDVLKTYMQWIQAASEGKRCLQAQGEKMVVLAARSAQDLHTFQEQAASLDLPSYMVRICELWVCSG